MIKSLNSCPEIVQYTTKEWNDLATAVEKLAKSSPIPGVINDYLTLRDKVIACHKYYKG